MDTNRLIPLLSEMAIFVNVVDSGSFSNTAKKLGVSPSSVSRSITRLENALEEKLLERTTRQMRLSSTGQEVYSLCSDMINSAKMAVSAAQADKTEVSGVLRVAAPKALSRQVLMPMVLDFIDAFPNVALQLKVADHYIDPIGDEVDVIVHITDKPTEGLIAKTLTQCRLVMCASPDYLEQHGIPIHPEDISSHNCLCLGENPRDRVWDFTNNHKKVSINVNGSFAVNHSEIRREAVLRGVGVSVFPEFAIQDYVESGEVIEILRDWHVGGNYQGKVIAQYAQSKFIPGQIKTFVDYIQDRFSQL
ncbi:LysR family transcriptional regulator [Vibrio europaeus]|uniref:LysR family transcriptional regulator n=1 Tax=Vibrio europaeus TaxID=300876 RepID=A0A178J6I7_9VIBR|nr:LysR family transcriptional regulator [Vibrio europaeus]MDC5705868.1 LysR family transcriptional regulator [Vibrio europaeus]MDC5709278.1 LysR family transcriptional regulator [Vibrio europaeus]MDC5713677.1 LysR family transcriptional regulator [Vibrio europaeus]MDC5720397.1 LysR family transcriptional regulator [Vibrio europaeus]MDC5723716.1 LysR family transcriptional regulator [Vibrio europaeus]